MKDNKSERIVLFCLGGIVIIWIALLIAPNINGGLVEIINNLPKKLETPFEIEFCGDSTRTILIFLFAYFLGIEVYISSKRNYRRGKEYGSAIWGITKQINKKYMQFPKSQNKILTQNTMMGLDARKHRRNLNVLVVGGSRSRENKVLCKTKCNAVQQCICNIRPKRRNTSRYRTLIRKTRL